jgi:hypothetical protein
VWTWASRMQKALKRAEESHPCIRREAFSLLMLARKPGEASRCGADESADQWGSSSTVCTVVLPVKVLHSKRYLL